MDPDFWHSRWRDGRLGFHLDKPNPRLVEHHDFLGAARRVLVPLCGKSNDLSYLADAGHEVIGIELSPIAATAYFAEHDVVPGRSRAGAFERLQHGRTTILVGDFFASAPEALGGLCDGAFDRAALIALPPAMRADYVRMLRSLLAPGAAILLVALEFDAPGGPPFSVADGEVRRHYGDAHIEDLGVTEAPSDSRGVLDRGASRVVERAYGIRLP